jgi:predicted transcriptional regulator
MKQRTKSGTFAEFKTYTLEVARGERKVEPSEPRVWVEPVEHGKRRRHEIQFASLEAGAKLLSAKNRMLLRAIAEQEPKSVVELATIIGRAEQNVLRTLKKLEAAGVVRLDRGEGRARRPVLAARKVHFEIDLLGMC